MRLLTKNALVLLLSTLIIFSAGGFVFYFQLRNIMNEEAIEALQLRKIKVERYVSQNKKLPETGLPGELISITEAAFPVTERLNDRMIYNEEEQEELPYKQLSFNLALDRKNYQCTLSKSLLESDDLIETIFQSFAIIVSALILVFTAINFIFSKIIWRPFFSTLRRINDYEIETHQVLTIESKGAKEFQQLNEAVKKMTEKISRDFNNLKSFTENASHESQTPLAIIKNKTELLLQTDGLSPEQIKQIIEINQTVNRLSKLNQTLLLMSKIENNQFHKTETVNFTDIVSNKLKQLDDLIEMKHLNIVSSLDKVMVTIHPTLADIIVANLLYNAIKYTPEKGKIELELSNSAFKILNEGEPLRAGNDKLFERFYKENEDSSSSGLGLALVKQIANICRHEIKYNYANSFHQFSYMFHH